MDRGSEPLPVPGRRVYFTDWRSKPGFIYDSDYAISIKKNLSEWVIMGHDPSLACSGSGARQSGIRQAAPGHKDHEDLSHGSPGHGRSPSC